MVTIQFVAKLLRSKVNCENTNCFKDKINLIDHNKEIKKNFWGYVNKFIKKPSRPTIDFCREPPSYQEIAKIIRKMKASGSPCSLDQVSVICLKRCPYLRRYLTAIVVEIWKSGHIPVTWKKTVSILIHEKGDSDKPENFCPIILEPVLLKVFTSLLRDQIYRFLQENNYINAKSKKVLYRDYLEP